MVEGAGEEEAGRRRRRNGDGEEGRDGIEGESE